MALQGALHRVWGDLVEVSGTHERVLHHCGLHETQPCQSVCHKVPWPVCHLGRSSHLLLVAGVAAGVHEVTGTGRLPWKPVHMVLNEIGDQREGWILCTLSRDCSGNNLKLLDQWEQHGGDVVCSEEGVPVGTKTVVRYQDLIAVASGCWCVNFISSSSIVSNVHSMSIYYIIYVQMY